VGRVTNIPPHLTNLRIEGDVMKVKVLKNGKWAIKPPENDYLLLKVGEIRTDIPSNHIPKMVKFGWVEIIDPGNEPVKSPQVIPEPKVDTDITPTSADSPRAEEPYSVEKDLKDIVSMASNEKEAKELLKIWGQERGFKVKKNYGVKKIVATLIKEYNAS